MVSQGSSTERLLYAFSRAFLADPRGGLPLDAEARRVYALLQNQVEQVRKIRGAFVMKDYELAKMSLEELLRPVLQEYTPEKIATTFTPEQLVGALTPEQIAKTLTPEQIAKALTPEQIAKVLEAALPPEVWEQVKQRLH